MLAALPCFAVLLARSALTRECVVTSETFCLCAAGDRGFDPLRFGSNTDVLPWYFEAERYNGRMAMLAVAGILFTDAVGLPKWYNAGAEVRGLAAFLRVWGCCAAVCSRPRGRVMHWLNGNGMDSACTSSLAMLKL